MHEIRSELEFLCDINNYKNLSYLKVKDVTTPVTMESMLSVSKILDGFEGFGYPDEGRMVGELLKCIGTFDHTHKCYVFRPIDI